MIFYSVNIFDSVTGEVEEDFGYFRDLNFTIAFLTERTEELGNSLPNMEEFIKCLRSETHAKFGCFTVISHKFEEDKDRY